MFCFKIHQYASLVGTALLLGGCEIVTDPETGKPVQDSPTPIPSNPITGPNDPRLRDPALGLTRQEILAFFADTSCDALEDEPVGDDDQGLPPDYRRGIRGKLSIPPEGFVDSDWHSLDRYDDSDAVVHFGKLFFSNLNIPTRAFDAGFPMFGGGLLQNSAGSPLYEYFRIDFDGFLELRPEDAEGEYELAIISDDGAQLEVGLEQTAIINHPLYTPSKLMCGNQPVGMYRNMVQPMHLAWFQGPRYHIANVLMWRPKSATPEPLCNLAGNGTWFDSTQVPSVPQSSYNELLSRGWKPLATENFRIPDDELFNPCLSRKVRDVFGWE